MSTAIVCVLLIIIPMFGIRSYVRRLASGCYGSSGEKSPKRTKVKDRGPPYYPHQYTIEMDGMSYGSCAVHVENVLNATEGVWARVDLEAREAQVYMKQEYEDEVLKDAVKAVGYMIFKINHAKRLYFSVRGVGID